MQKSSTKYYQTESNNTLKESYIRGLPGGAVVEGVPANVGDMGLSPGQTCLLARLWVQYMYSQGKKTLGLPGG